MRKRERENQRLSNIVVLFPLSPSPYHPQSPPFSAHLSPALMPSASLPLPHSLTALPHTPYPPTHTPTPHPTAPASPGPAGDAAAVATVCNQRGRRRPRLQGRRRPAEVGGGRTAACTTGQRARNSRPLADRRPHVCPRCRSFKFWREWVTDSHNLGVSEEVAWKYVPRLARAFCPPSLYKFPFSPSPPRLVPGTWTPSAPSRCRAQTPCACTTSRKTTVGSESSARLPVGK